MAAVDAPTLMMTFDIPTNEIVYVERQKEHEEPGVRPAICTWESVNRIREQGGIMEATTSGLFMLPEGDKEYKTFLEMVQDQPQQPDPIFKEGDVIPTIEDAGFPLDRQDEIDAEFKKMYDEMFSRSSELGVMGAGDFEGYLSQRKQAYNEMFRQNELSEGKIENLNGGGTNVLLKRRSSIHETKCPTTPFHTPVSISSAGSFAPSVEEGSNENNGCSDVEGSRSSLD
jgi:hypothetical protein